MSAEITLQKVIDLATLIKVEYGSIHEYIKDDVRDIISALQYAQNETVKIPVILGEQGADVKMERLGNATVKFTSYRDNTIYQTFTYQTSDCEENEPFVLLVFSLIQLGIKDKVISYIHGYLTATLADAKTAISLIKDKASD